MAYILCRGSGDDMCTPGILAVFTCETAAAENWREFFVEEDYKQVLNLYVESVADDVVEMRNFLNQFNRMRRREIANYEDLLRQMWDRCRDNDIKERLMNLFYIGLASFEQLETMGIINGRTAYFVQKMDIYSNLGDRTKSAV